MPGDYYVHSVGMTAVAGGVNTNEGDDIDAKSIWVMANWLAGSAGFEDGGLVQNAIWHIEEEGIAATEGWTDLLGIAGINEDDFNFADAAIVKQWDIQVVNLTLGKGGAHKQSQLVGVYAPVPEPATMVLFGIGLIGLAGIGRRKVNK